MSWRLQSAGLLLASCIHAAAAQDDISDALEGFEDGFADVIELADESPAADSFQPKAWSLSGNLIASSSWNIKPHQSSSGTDYSDLSKLRAQLRLGLDGRHGDNWRSSWNLMAWHDAAYALREADYSPEVLKAYENEFQIQDAWIAGRVGNSTDLKLGRQLAVIGFADNLRVLDIINPLDNREPGLSDIEDLRRPSGMLRIDHFTSSWQLTALAIGENRFSENPPYGSDFYSIVNANGEAIRIREEQAQNFEQPGFAVTATGRFSGWDLNLMAAELWHDTPYLDASAFDSSDPNATEQDFAAASVLRHSRSQYFGFGLQATAGSWLFRQEAMLINKLRLTRSEELESPMPLLDEVFSAAPLIGDSGNPLNPGQGQILPSDSRDTQRFDWLLGVEYFGLAQTNIAIEISGRHIQHFDQDLAWSGYLKWRGETAIRLIRDFMNERLRTTVIAVLLHRDGRFWESSGGGIYRLNADYDFGAGWRAGGGILLFEAGEQQPFTVAGDNDRIFAELKYSF